ncbi:hypothetical protein E2C01_085843 [Portunus trituberculatus]|uniref:Uncharacterized protein n=1 Tax=Portunus trituberculatus TaxID=210409 RepID=A0A5B7J7S3_PORTR|nr:hypothetical protein [Portunus trituberculatus]
MYCCNGCCFRGEKYGRCNGCCYRRCCRHRGGTCKAQSKVDFCHSGRCADSVTLWTEMRVPCGFVDTHLHL